MIATAENIEKLDTYLKAYDISCDEDALGKMLLHLDLVVEKNKVMNLTRIVDPDQAIVRHVVDSLLLMPSLSGIDVAGGVRLLDIGTGAGFPGIPLALATGYKTVLIDSVGKKVNAVAEFIRELGIERHAEALNIRAEDLARKQAGSFDLVTARAVDELRVLVEYASPLLKKHGLLVVSKANITDDELVLGKKTASLVGVQYVSRETYELPDDAGHREILTFKKIGKSRVKLPRQNGSAKHKLLV